MAEELFEAVRERAGREGRSVSGEIVFILRERVQTEAPKRPSRPITGWLKDFATPESLAEYSKDRRWASASLLRAVERKARSK